MNEPLAPPILVCVLHFTHVFVRVCLSLQRSACITAIQYVLLTLLAEQTESRLAIDTCTAALQITKF